MKRYTVLGVFGDVVVDGDPQRYASYFDADDAEHAEEQAIDEASETLIIAGVIEGEAKVVS